MFARTVDLLQCPRCAGALALPKGAQSGEIRSGELLCTGGCKSQFPILAGVAVLVEDVGTYLAEHVKGLAQIVKDEEIPKAYRRDYLAAKEEIQVEHIEEDLEAERVVALYVMNHYLDAAQAAEGVEDPLLSDLIRTHWKKGPLDRVAQHVDPKGGLLVELSCGVGGLYPRVAKRCERYLGVDSSFTSVAIGRHLALGAPYAGRIRVPRDLLDGPVSATPRLNAPSVGDGSADLVVGDLFFRSGAARRTSRSP